MAKRSKPKFKPSVSPLAAETPRERGLRLFKMGKYGEAIQQWSALDLEGDAPLRTALAEAHFRRFVTSRHPVGADRADLDRALQLSPDDGRVHYQFALAFHRSGDLQGAEVQYARAEELGYQGRGAGMARALAQLEYHPDLALDSLPWLDAKDRAALVPVAALVQGRPEEVPAPEGPEPSSTDPSGLWAGLAALMGTDYANARARLTLPSGRHLPGEAEAVRAFYYGLAATAAGDVAAGLEAWRHGAVAHGPASLVARARDAEAALQGTQISAWLASGEWEKVLDAAYTTLATHHNDTRSLRLALVALHRLARRDADAGNWASAAEFWYQLLELLEKHPELGPVEPVWKNYALASEGAQLWDEAADSWADVLSSLPKRETRKQASGGGPSLAQQRDWLRRRILDDYRRAGNPDEAIKYFKQAVKADPDNLDLRLEMASALLANEQEVAARNEANRILARDPKHVDAQLLLVQIHTLRHEFHLAEQILRKVVKQAPEHVPARKALAAFLLSRGTNLFNANRIREAAIVYREALEVEPENLTVRVYLSEAELILKQKPAALERIEAILQENSFEGYGLVFDMWMRQEDFAAAKAVVERAQASGVGTWEFKIEAGARCLEHSAPPSMPGYVAPPPTPEKARLEKWGEELIEQGIAESPDPGAALQLAIEAVGPMQIRRVVQYARRKVDLNPMDPQEYLSLATFQAMSGETARAKTTLRTAESLARKQGNSALTQQLFEMRRDMDSGMMEMLGPMLALGPDALEEFDEDLFR